MSKLELHQSWTFRERRTEIEELLNDIHTLLKGRDHEIGVVTAALLFALVGSLREIADDNALAVESKMVEVTGMQLLSGLDAMYSQLDRQKRKKSKDRVH